MTNATLLTIATICHWSIAAPMYHSEVASDNYGAQRGCQKSFVRCVQKKVASDKDFGQTQIEEKALTECMLEL